MLRATIQPKQLAREAGRTRGSQPAHEKDNENSPDMDSADASIASTSRRRDEHIKCARDAFVRCVVRRHVDPASERACPSPHSPNRPRNLRDLPTGSIETVLGQSISRSSSSCSTGRVSIRRLPSWYVLRSTDVRRHGPAHTHSQTPSRSHSLARRASFARLQDIMYKKFDKDSDGSISFEEFIEAMVEDWEEQELEEEFREIRELFSLLDKDGSRHLSVGELKALIRMLGVDLKSDVEDRVVDKLFDGMKRTGVASAEEDGVTIDQFAAFLLAQDEES